MGIYDYPTWAGNTTTGSSAVINTIGYPGFQTQYYSIPPVPHAVWYRLPYPMSLEEAQRFVGTALNTVHGLLNNFLAGYWVDGSMLRGIEAKLVSSQFPPGYNPNNDWIPDLNGRGEPSFEIKVVLPSSSDDLNAESQVSLKTRVLLKAKGQNDYIPDTSLMIDSFLSKIKANERVKL